MDSSPRTEFLVSFMFFQILGGQIAIPLIILTVIFSKHVNRHKIFLNFLGAYVLYSFSFTLLLYSGQLLNPKPPFALCLIQAGMVRAAPPMVAVAVFTFALHLNISIRELMSRNSGPEPWRFRFPLIIAAPYVMYTLIFIITTAVGAAHQDEVVKYPYYCTVTSEAVIDVGETFSAVSLLAAGFTQGWTSFHVYKQWKVIRSKSTSDTTSYTILVRPFLLLVITLISFITSIVFIADEAGPVTNMTLALIPVLVFLIFGTQADLWRVWLFWRKTEARYSGLRDSTMSTGSARASLISSTKRYKPIELESSNASWRATKDSLSPLPVLE